MKKLIIRTLLGSAILSSIVMLHAQQSIQLEVYPQTSRAIEGKLSLERQKYINLATSGTNIQGTIGDQERTDRYFKELDMTLGRALGMVYGEVTYGNSIYEDPARPEYTDIPRMKGLLHPSNAGASSDFMNLIGPNQHVAFHDRHDSYPDFMEKYSKPNNNNAFPVNNDAASELAAALLEFNYTDWTRPAFFEPVNEPDYRYWSEDKFIELHTSIHEKTRQAGLTTLVGGPCLAVGYHYKNKYGNLNQITDFIDRTNFQLDFYSYHIYDYMKWSDEAFDFTGRISSGLPTEGVFDAIANHTVNAFGEPFTYITSEHGSYITDTVNRDYAQDKLADLYFPGSGFEHTMEKRSISDHLAVSSEIASTFTFMNHPHIVEKAVPFILLESFDWDADYYASLLVANNFTEKGNWVESKRIHFYEFFKDVKGRRVLSFCDDPDIQHHTFVDEDKMILIFNNQSNVAGTINLQVNDSPGQVKSMMVRRFGRFPDFRPYLTEERLSDFTQLEIGEREAVALFVAYEKPLPEKEILNEKVHYGNDVGLQFSGSRDIEIQMPDFEDATYAILRVGIGLTGNASTNVDLSINGTALVSQVEDCAERLTDGGEYGSTRFARIDPALLQEVNTIQISFPDGQSGGVGAAVIRAGYASTDTLTGFEFTLHELSLYPFQEDSLVVRYFPETSAERDLNWMSQDESVAVVSARGVIRGVAEGQTHIIGSSADGLISDTCVVSIVKQDLISRADKSGWTVVYVDDEATIGGLLKELAIDDDPDTYWHTEWQGDDIKPLPHEIWVDMGDTLEFEHFIYTPRQDQWSPNATIGDYELYFSNDTSDWGVLAQSGSFQWDTAVPYYYNEIQDIQLSSPVTARYFRLVALTEHQNDPEVVTTAAAELDVSIEASGILLKEDSIEISMGETRSLELLTLPLLGSIDGDQFQWYVEDPAVAGVESGKVSGEGPGETSLIVAGFDGLFRDTCHVKVAIVPVSEILISMPEATMKVGETTILTAEILPANAYHNSIRWESDDKTVAEVSMGYVLGTGIGTARIMAVSSDGIHRDTCTVSVHVAEYDVEILVKDPISGELLPDVLVTLAGVEKQTGENGSVLFEKVARGDQAITLSHDLYQTTGTNLDIYKDNAYDFDLQRSQYTLDFIVTDFHSGDPVLLARVDVGETRKSTLTGGKASFEKPWGDYDFTVSKQGYDDVAGFLSLQNDTTVNVVLSLTTGMQTGLTKNLSIYPVPAEDIMHISIPDQGLLKIYSLEGVILEEVNLVRGDQSISVAAFESGIYLFEFRSGDNRELRLIPVIR